MFTQAMPAVIDALRQVLPPQAIGPLVQAMGNCGQPLSHRAGVNFVSPHRPNVNGTYGSNGGRNASWNPARYQHLYPGGDTYNGGNYHTQVDVGGMDVAWNAGNRYDSQFFFPTNQVFQQNQFFGGPTVNIQGGAAIDYINNDYFEGDTVSVENTTTQFLNGDPVAGPAGPPGALGRDGQRGAPGAPGAFFGALPPGFFGPIRYLTGRPRINFIGERVARAHRYMKDAWLREAVTIDVPTDAISGGTVPVDPAPVAVYVPTEITFNPDICAVSISASTLVYAFPSEPSYFSISGTSANTQTVYAATTAASTLASLVPESGFVIKGADADFWERNPTSVVIAREPKIQGIGNANARVYQQ